MADSYTPEQVASIYRRKQEEALARIKKEQETVTAGKFIAAVRSDPKTAASSVWEFVKNETLLGGQIAASKFAPPLGLNVPRPTQQEFSVGEGDFKTTPATVAGDWATLGAAFTNAMLPGKPYGSALESGQNVRKYFEQPGTIRKEFAEGLAVANAAANIFDVYGLAKGVTRAVARRAGKDITKLSRVIANTSDEAKIAEYLEKYINGGKNPPPPPGGPAIPQMARSLRTMTDVKAIGKYLEDSLGVPKTPRGVPTVPRSSMASITVRAVQDATTKAVNTALDRFLPTTRNIPEPTPAMASDVGAEDFVRTTAKNSTPEAFTESIGKVSGDLTITDDGPRLVRNQTDAPGAIFTGTRILDYGADAAELMARGVPAEEATEAERIAQRAAAMFGKQPGAASITAIERRLAAEAGYQAIRRIDPETGEEVLDILDSRKIRQTDLTYDQLYRGAEETMTRAARADATVTTEAGKASRTSVRIIQKLYQDAFGVGDAVVTQSKLAELMKSGRVPFGKGTRALTTSERAAIQESFDDLSAAGDVTARRLYENMATRMATFVQNEFDVPNMARGMIHNRFPSNFREAQQMTVTEARGFKNSAGEVHLGPLNVPNAKAPKSYAWHHRWIPYVDRAGRHILSVQELQSDYFSKILTWFSPREFSRNVVSYMTKQDLQRYHRSNTKQARSSIFEAARARMEAMSETVEKQARSLWAFRNDWWKRGIDDIMLQAAKRGDDEVHFPTALQNAETQGHARNLAQHVNKPLRQLPGVKWLYEDPEVDFEALLGVTRETANNVLLPSLDAKSASSAIATLNDIIKRLTSEKAVDNFFEAGYPEDLDTILDTMSQLREHLTVFRAYDKDFTDYLKKYYGAVEAPDQFGNSVLRVPVKPEYNAVKDSMFGVRMAGVTILAGMAIADSDEEGDPWLPLVGIGGLVMGPHATSFVKMKALGKTWRGLDGVERFEISDYVSKLTKKGEQAMSTPMALRADELLEHNQLFTEYPILKKTVIETRPGSKFRPGVMASFDVAKNKIYVNMDANDLGGAGVATFAGRVSTLLHEFQHNIQKLEGMSPGGDAASFRPIALLGYYKRVQQDLLDVLNEMNRSDILRASWRMEVVPSEQLDKAVEWTNEVQEFTKTRTEIMQDMLALDDLIKRYEKLQSVRNQMNYIDPGKLVGGPNDIYRALHGEAEARAVQRRMRMTDQAREAIPFERTLLQEAPPLFEGKPTLVTMGAKEAKVFAPKSMLSAIDEGFEGKTPMQRRIDANNVGTMKHKQIVTTDVALLRKKIGAIAKGARMGAAGTRAEIRELQGQLLEVIKRGLPTKYRNKYLNLVKKTNTPTQLNNALELVHRDIEAFFELRQERLRLSSKRSKIGFLRHLGEMDQRVMKDIKKTVGIRKALRDMDETELDAVIAEAWERLKYASENNLLKKSRPTPRAISPEDDAKLDLDVKKNWKDRLKLHLENARETADKSRDIIGIMSTELRDISEKLFVRMRSFEYDLLQSKKEGRKVFEELWRGINESTITPDEYKRLVYAMLNGMPDTVNEIAQLNGFEKQLFNWRKYTADVFKRMKAAGFQVDERANYFPRYVKSTKEARRMIDDYFTKGDARGLFEREFKAYADSLKRPVESLTLEERVKIIQNILRGFRGKIVSVSEQGPMLQRVIQNVPVELMDAYEDPIRSMARYVEETEERIALREFVGGRAKGLSNDVIDDALLNENTFAHLLSELVSEGVQLSAEQQKRVVQLFKARFAGGTMGAIQRGAKQLGYITLLGNIQSAITNIGDLYSTFYQYGVWRGLGSIWDEIFNKNTITLEDFNINKVMEELDAEGGLAKWMNKFFVLSGFKWMDVKAKNIFLNAGKNDASIRAQRVLAGKSSKGDAAFEAKMQLYFGDRAREVMTKLANKVQDDDTLFYIFNELSDYQPITLSEMPVKYLETNMKILYQMKTWTLRMLDVYRREVIKEFRRGNKVQATKNFVRLTTFLMALNLSAQEIKDFLNGKDVDIEDNVMNEFLKLIGLNRYTVSTIGQEGLGSAIMEQVTPPVLSGPIDTLTKGDAERMIRYTPVVGPVLYNQLNEAGLIEPTYTFTKEYKPSKGGTSNINRGGTINRGGVNRGSVNR